MAMFDADFVGISWGCHEKSWISYGLSGMKPIIYGGCHEKS
jgi:hypothetical protein